VENIDWPGSPTDSASVQQVDLVNYVELIDSLNMNAIVFQARTTGDALYPSDIEPWSKCVVFLGIHFKQYYMALFTEFTENLRREHAAP